MNQTIWSLDPAHSAINFKVKHLMISYVKGNFNQFDIKMDGEHFENAKITVQISVDSINTNNSDRDAHLKSGDFFDATTYPSILFESSSMIKLDDENYKLKGNLTLKDVTLPIELDVEFGGSSKDPWGNEKIAFEVSGIIHRKDFGLAYNAALETGGVLIGEDVKLNAEIQFVKQSS